MKFKFSLCCLHLWILLWLASPAHSLAEPISSDQKLSFNCSIAVEFPVIAKEKCQDYVVDRQSVSNMPGPGKIKTTACLVETIDPEDKIYFIYTSSPDWPVWLCRNERDRESSQQTEPPILTITIADEQTDALGSEIPAVSSGGYGDDFFYDKRPRKPGMPGVIPVLLGTVSAGLLPAGVVSFAFDLEFPELSDNSPVLFQQGVMSDGSDILVIISGTQQRIYRRGYQLGSWYLAGQVDSAALLPNEEQLDDFIAEDKLVRALAGVFGWAGKDSVPINQLPLGKRETSNSEASGGKRGSTGGSGASSFGYSMGSKGGSQGQGSWRDDGDQPSQPPKTFREFFHSPYYNRLSNPHLFALGFGLNPFILEARSDEGLKIINVFIWAVNDGLLHRFFHAVEFHNAVMEGRTNYMHWMYEPGESSLPLKPTLYYLAQVQPVNWETMAAVLSLQHETGEIRANYPSNARLQQLAMFNRILDMGKVDWELFAVAYSASEATNHLVPESSNRILEVEPSFGEELGIIDQTIKGQMRLFPSQDRVVLREAIRILLPPEISHVFAAALGLNPHIVSRKNPDNSISASSLFCEAERRIIDFNWNHIAVAAHVAGHLGAVREQQQLTDYISRYGDIHVDPITGNTNYLEVRQMVSKLLSQIAQRNMELQKLSRDTSQPATATPLDSLSTLPADSSTKPKTCCVCLEKETNELFIPCKHLACCSDCSGKLDLCPKCRGKICERIKVYNN